MGKAGECLGGTTDGSGDEVEREERAVGTGKEGTLPDICKGDKDERQAGMCGGGNSGKVSDNWSWLSGIGRRIGGERLEVHVEEMSEKLGS